MFLVKLGVIKYTLPLNASYFQCKIAQSVINYLLSVLFRNVRRKSTLAVCQGASEVFVRYRLSLEMLVTAHEDIRICRETLGHGKYVGYYYVHA